MCIYSIGLGIVLEGLDLLWRDIMQPAQLKPMSDKMPSNSSIKYGEEFSNSSLPSSIPYSSTSDSTSAFARFSFISRFKHNLIVPRSIWLIGFVMCLINISFVVVYSLSPLFLYQVMGVSTFLIVQLEHAVEGLSFLMKLFSGIISDYFRRRKPLMLLGYSLGVMSKLVFALAASTSMVVPLVICSRFFERLGNGLQSTPRDALVGDIAPAAHRARSLGLMRSLGTAGSCLGGILGFVAMLYTDGNFQQVFWIACIPAIIALCLLAACIKEPKTHVDTDGKILEVKKDRRPIKLSDLKLLGPHYWALMVIVVIFMLARFSEAVLVLYTNNSLGLNQMFAPLIVSLYSVSTSLSTYPSGLIADKCGRKAVLVFGICALIVSDFFLFAGRDLTEVFIGIFIWGIQMGVVQNTFMSLIADYIPEDLRGTGFGMYYLISSVGALIAGSAGSTILKYYGAQYVFLGSMAMGICALLALLILLPSKKKAAMIAASL